jgi:N-acyl-L-homoserine lactone synthetase
MRKQNLYVYSKAVGHLREEAIALHYQRYKEVGFLKQNEIDPYEKDSIYFIAETMEQNKVVGVTRLITKKLEELPTITNFSIFDLELVKLAKLDNSRLVEVSAFTKMPQHDVGMGLIRTIMQYSVEQNIENWLCCIDERVYNYLNRMFSFPFQVIGEPKVYLGSTSIPCLFPINEGLQHIKEKKYRLYEFLMTREHNQIGGIL